MGIWKHGNNLNFPLGHYILFYGTREHSFSIESNRFHKTLQKHMKICPCKKSVGNFIPNNPLVTLLGNDKEEVKFYLKPFFAINLHSF